MVDESISLAIKMLISAALREGKSNERMIGTEFEEVYKQQLQEFKEALRTRVAAEQALIRLIDDSINKGGTMI